MTLAPTEASREVVDEGVLPTFGTSFVDLSTFGTNLHSLPAFETRAESLPAFEVDDGLGLLRSRETDTWVLESSVPGTADWHLVLLLVFSTLGSLLIFSLAAIAFRRRRSLPYLLIIAALGALVLRPIVGTLTVVELLSMEYHHTVEHLLDAVIAGILISAVYAVGSIETERATNRTDQESEEPYE